jgi:ribosome-associated protein
MDIDDDDARWPIVAARAADEKGGEDVVVLEVGPVMALCSHFVIVSASNTRLARTIAEAVEQEIADQGGPRPLRIEGLDDLRWVLMDYGDFVVHVFAEETRRYYDLERLWSDVPRVDWREAAPA